MDGVKEKRNPPSLPGLTFLARCLTVVQKMLIQPASERSDWISDLTLEFLSIGFLYFCPLIYPGLLLQM